MKTNLFLKTRRQALGKTSSQGCFLIFSGKKIQKSPHSFRATSDFLYYAGLNIEGAYLFIEGNDCRLFVEEADALKKIWDGQSYDEAEIHQAGFEQFSFTSELPQVLAKKKAQNIFSNQKIENIDSQDFPWEAKKIRLLKDSEEIASLRKAAEISATVHSRLISFLREGQSEKEIALFLDSQFRALGSERNAYENVVASGERACVLHALASSKLLKKGELLLVDAACEYDFYASDITRTYSVDRRLRVEQESIYDLVLSTQKSLLAAVQPGKTLRELHQLGQNLFHEGLSALGILKQASSLSALYPHNTSHWIGLDVHDVGNSSTHDVLLQENMCFTVEPGLYFQERLGIEKYSSIGIRIEDDVRVTSEGCEVLTALAPKEKQDLFF